MWFQDDPFIEVWGTIPFAEAERKAKRYNLDLADGSILRKEAEKRKTTCEVFSSKWLRKKQAEIEHSSYTRYRAAVDNFLSFLAVEQNMAGCQLIDIDYAVADDFKTHRRTTPIAPNGRKHLRKLKDGAAKSTVHFEVSTLTQMFDEAVARSLIEENPFANVKAAKPKMREIVAKHHPLSSEEEKALLCPCARPFTSYSSAFRPQNAATMYFLITTEVGVV
mgnify:CR=1 FL=1